MTDQQLSQVVRAQRWDGTKGDRGPAWRQLTPARHLAATAARVPHHEAVRFEGRGLTWQEVDVMANRAANGLLALGVKPGDVVGLLAANVPETLACMYGMSRAGIAFLPLNPRLTAAEVAWQMDDVQATLLLSSDHTPVADVMARGHDVTPDVEEDEDRYFWVRFTSGTTGRPRAVAATQRSVATLFQMMALDLDYAPTDVALVNAPLAHASLGFAAAHLLLGATLVLERSFDATQVWLECDRHAVTHLFMVPTMFALALDQPGSGDSIEAFLSMASIFPPSLKDRVAARFPRARLYDSYAGTEFGAATLLRPEEAASKSRSVGLPRFGCRIKVLDDQGRELPAGEIGEIYIQGPSICDAFVGSVPPSTTAIRDGWLSAGDLGWRDEDGFLYIADRRDDLIVSGGFNVYPTEVEDVLLRVPGVREASVVGVSDPTWGQVVTAVVVGDVAVDQLDSHCRSLLANYKAPRRFEFVAELPKNPSGKVLRRALRETFERRPGDSVGE